MQKSKSRLVALFSAFCVVCTGIIPSSIVSGKPGGIEILKGTTYSERDVASEEFTYSKQGEEQHFDSH